MDLNKINKVYFLGIGGIGMSAIARFFLCKGADVAGYDKTPSDITDNLSREGADIHFDDNPNKIPHDTELIIYTPAIPKDLNEFVKAANSGKPFFKRAQVLGMLSENLKTIAVAGTHGKTTVSSFIAHILKTANYNFSAFVGGIMTNYESNFVSNGKPEWLVVEADEFDKSFLQLNPEIAVITAMDPDHLDVYGDKDNMVNTFAEFANKIKPEGKLFMKKGLQKFENYKGQTFSYHHSEAADIYGSGHLVNKSKYYADFNGLVEVHNVNIGLPGLHNLENALAATAVANALGVKKDIIIKALTSFKGIKRRFEICFNNESSAYIDDYAHHPEEIKACISAARELFPGKSIIGVFQPHLYTRTRDFAKGFADSLSKLDELLLMDIYPAREKPLPGISSEVILEAVKLEKKKMVSKAKLLETLANSKYDIILTMGAGDIDRFQKQIKTMVENKFIIK